MVRQAPEKQTLRPFGSCTVPASRVSRPAQWVLPPEQLHDTATPSPPVVQELTPLPVLIHHGEGSEECLNPHVATRLSTPLRPETLLWCQLVDPDSLYPEEFVELLEFRYRLLEPIYNPCPGHSDADAFKAAIMALAESSSLRELVLRYFLPQEKAISGQVLADLFLNRVTKRTVLNYANQVASPPPWDDGTPQISPTPQQKARQYWEAYRTQEHPNLPPFEEAIRTFKNHAPDVPHPGEEHQVFSKILLDRLDPIHGETDAFPVIATFLAEAGHLLGERPVGTAKEQPHLPNPKEPRYDDPPGTGVETDPIVDKVSEGDTLLNRVLAITAGESGDLARSDKCWAQLLARARKFQTPKGRNYYEFLQDRLDDPSGGEQPQDVLRKFIKKMRDLNDLPC